MHFLNFRGVFQKWPTQILFVLAVSALIVSFQVIYQFGNLWQVSMSELKNRHYVSAYVDESISDEKLSGVALELEQIEGIDRVVYIDRVSFANAMEKRFPNLHQELSKVRNVNVLPRYFRLTVNSANQESALDQIVTRVSGLQGIDFVEANRKRFLGVIQAVTKLEKILWIFLGAVIVLMLFSFYYSVRIRVHEESRQLEILRELGATNWYLMSPFITQGLLLGGLAGALASLGFAFWGAPVVGTLASAFASQISSSSQALDFSISPHLSLLNIALPICYGLFTGLIGSFIASLKVRSSN